MEPRGVGAAGDEGGLESTMQTLDHAVGVMVMGRRLVVCWPKDLVKSCPQQGGEGGAPVGGDVLRNTKSGDPCGEEGSGAGCGRGVD